MATRHVQKLLDFLKLGSRLEKTNGFTCALGLDYERVSGLSNNLTFDKTNTLKFRLPIEDSIFLPNCRTISLSTCIALIDEITTWAVVLADPQKSRPGVSVTLQGEMTQFPFENVKEVDVIAQVNKVGRNLGFINAEIRNTTGELLFFGSHVKYLSSMGMVADFLLSHYGWHLAMLYANHIATPGKSNVRPMSKLFESIEFKSDKHAVFQVTPEHASGGGPIHGGAQAILMELAAAKVAKEELNTRDVTLESMSIEYMSPPSVQTEILIEVLHRARDHVSLRVSLAGKGKTKSEGILRFSVASSSTVSSKL